MYPRLMRIWERSYLALDRRALKGGAPKLRVLWKNKNEKLDSEVGSAATGIIIINLNFEMSVFILFFRMVVAVGVLEA